MKQDKFDPEDLISSVSALGHMRDGIVSKYEDIFNSFSGLLNEFDEKIIKAQMELKKLSYHSKKEDEPVKKVFLNVEEGMVHSFIDVYMKNKRALKSTFSRGYLLSYGRLINNIVSFLDKSAPQDRERYSFPEPGKEIVFYCGDYSGDVFFILPSRPDEYARVENCWAGHIKYGSCSGCDLIEDMKDKSKNQSQPDEQDVEDYMQMSLHILQSIRKVEG